MRAYSDNEDLALLSGINPERVVMITWILAAALATHRRHALRARQVVPPIHLLPAPAADLRRGDGRRLGQPLGAIGGGFLIAFSEVMVTYAYKGFSPISSPRPGSPRGSSRLLGTDYKFAVSFIILVLVLLVRPTGIFRGRAI